MPKTPYVEPPQNKSGTDNVCLVNYESVGHATESVGGDCADSVERVRLPRVAWRGQESIVSRFWAKVERNGPLHPVLHTHCWQWTGCVVARYGQIALGHPRTPGSKRWKAHRFSWELFHGPIPDGLRVIHQCDNCLCVNPSHLRLGTQRENVHDAIRKGRRNAFGQQKLQADDVRIIRAQAARGIPTKDIASAFSVAVNTVRGILRGDTWAHLN
jgi:hypothetical protein